MHQRGLSLVECLLALTLGAILITLGLNSFHSYQQKITLSQVKHDVATLKINLDDFYHRQRCNSLGNLNPLLLKPHNLIALLNINFHSPTSRKPLITHYSAYISPLPHTNTNPKKQRFTIYTLTISATINLANLSPQAFLYLQEALNGQSETGSHSPTPYGTIQWTFMPHLNQSHRLFWVMGEQNESLKRRQSQPSAAYDIHNSYLFSCAH